ITFEADSIYDSNVDAVSDGVRALNRFPGIKLRSTEFGLLFRVPADARRVKNHLRTFESGQARAFRIPLVPANLNANTAEFGIEVREAEIAGREIELFVIERIVGDMHLAVFTEERSVGIENRTGVVIDAGGAAFEQGSD